MADELKPALTADEWARKDVRVGPCSSIGASDNMLTIDLDDCAYNSQCAYLQGSQRHAVAALCLYGQPFGFTPGDVHALNALSARLQREIEAAGPLEPYTITTNRPRINALRSLASRIASLLPPAVS